MAAEVFTVDLAQTVPSEVCSSLLAFTEFNVYLRLDSAFFAFDYRSNAFIYLHILLEGAVYAEFTYEVFGFCREMDTTLISLSVPYILLAIKTFFFYLCIKTDPGSFWFDHILFKCVVVVSSIAVCYLTSLHLSGTVTKKKVAGQLRIYSYDRRLFHPGISCSTCQLVKPARSKHCSECFLICQCQHLRYWEKKKGSVSWC